MSSAVPGADHAVMTGAFSHRLSTMPPRPAPTEMAQTHDAVISGDTWAACAAWNTMTSGPA